MKVPIGPPDAIRFSAFSALSTSTHEIVNRIENMITLPNHLHCALLMRSKACLFTIYESDANKVTFHSTL